MLLELALWTCILFVAHARSPNADLIEELVKSHAFGGRVSDNVIQDALLNLPDLVRKYNYPFEEHSVTTEDGYILGLHRIPHGRDSHRSPGNRTTVFIMHGFLMSSADNVIMGPGSALAYILADEGFDVWMGNARGTYFSRRHTSLNPDSLLNLDFWKFSLDDIGTKDVPALIDYVLQQTGKSALHYIGFSQGTTVFFIMGSIRPEYNEKIISMQAMAPVAYMEHITNPILRIMARFEGDIERLATLFRIGELFPNTMINTWIGKKFCVDGAITQPICSAIIFFAGGMDISQHNATMMPVVFGHTPAGVSVRQTAHFGQIISSKEFRRYDYGIWTNIIKYRSRVPPSYPLSQISAPVFLHYGLNDPLAVDRDVEKLFEELGNPIGMFKVQYPTFTHVDFMYGINAKTLIYDRLMNFIRVWDAKK